MVLGKRKRERIPVPQGRPYFLNMWPFAVILCLCLVGLFATGFLTYRHIALVSQTGSVGESFLCKASGKINCDAILLTDYAVLFGYISSAALGLAGFVFAFWLSANAILRPGLRKIALAALVIYFFGAIGFSWYFLYLIVFKVDYICTWCIVVHVINFTSLILILILAVKKRKDFLLEEIVSYPEQTYFILTGAALAMVVFLAATAIEKELSFLNAKAEYESLANDPVVIMAMLKASPTHDIPIGPDDPVYGRRDAEFPIIFFSDFQCPVCSKTEVFLKRLAEKNRDKLCLVYKSYPLSNRCNPTILDQGLYHPQSCPAAKAAYSAYMIGGMQAYQKYSDLLFKNQKQLDNSSWIKFAKEVGLDIKKFKELMKDGSPAHKKIQKDIKQGIELGIFATPQMYLLGKKVPEDYSGEPLIGLLEQIVRLQRPELKNFRLRRK